MSSIAENLNRVQDAIAMACRKAGRSHEDVRLMAVSKTHPVELLLEAAAAGHRLFGENRVQEFAAKAKVLAGIPLTDQVNVHMIGHLQSNKAALAAEVFSAIDTIDSLKLAERLHAAAEKAGRILPVLIEIKLSSEEAKEGIAPEDPALPAFLECLPNLTAHLPLRGLMTVAPISDDPEVARACFLRLRLLREKWAQQYPRLAFDELSMGMSGDFESAIEEGTTMVRIGTAIFGARPKPTGTPVLG